MCLAGTMTALCGHTRVTHMTTKKQRTTRRPKTPETPAEAGLTRAVEELVASGEYNGEQGFHDLVKLVSRRFVEAALRGELDAHLISGPPTFVKQWVTN